MAHADVLRCVDAAGHVSYTDQRCPAGTRQAGQVATPPAVERAPVETVERSATPRAPVEAAAPPVPPAAVPAGPIVFGPRPEERLSAQQREEERRRLEAEPLQPPVLYPPGYPDPYTDYGGYRRPPPPPRDMRPRLRNCDAAGCEDRMGNHYSPAGKVDRYVRPDGRTCRPVGTTVVCN